jgi:hypothetical protein
MEQETIDTKDIYMEAMLGKYEQLNEHIAVLEKQMSGIEETNKAISGWVKDIEPVKNSVSELRAMVKNQQFPTREMELLSRALTENVQQLKQPVESHVNHRHYVPKIVWAVVGLSLALCLACSGWYMTASASRQYQAGDTKYRQLNYTCPSRIKCGQMLSGRSS